MTSLFGSRIIDCGVELLIKLSRVSAHSTLACIIGALWARWCKRGILHEARDEGRRKNRAPVKSPLFWLFRPPTPTNIDWRRWCQKGQWKVDHYSKLVTFLATRNTDSSINHRKITTTREWITFNNVSLSAAKLRFSQPKFSLSSNTAARNKTENLLFKQIPRPRLTLSRAYE